MTMASTRETSFIPRCRSVRRSATSITRLQITRAPETTQIDDSGPSMASLKISPTTATGMEPMMIPQPSV